MLEIRACCENCGKNLPYNSTEAMICSFECTYCKDCVEKVFFNVCPNCGGGLERRPIRPQSYLDKYPISSKRIIKPVIENEFRDLLEKFKNIEPKDR